MAALSESVTFASASGQGKHILSRRHSEVGAHPAGIVSTEELHQKSKTLSEKKPHGKVFGYAFLVSTNDYLRFRKELQKLMQQSAGLDQFRLIEEQIGKAVQPLREIYSTESGLADSLRQTSGVADLEQIAGAFRLTSAPTIFRALDEQRASQERLISSLQSSISIQPLVDLSRDVARLSESFSNAAAFQREAMNLGSFSRPLDDLRGSAALLSMSSELQATIERVSSRRDHLTAHALGNSILELGKYASHASGRLSVTESIETRTAIEKSLLIASASLHDTTMLVSGLKLFDEMDLSMYTPRYLAGPYLLEDDIREIDLSERDFTVEELLLATPVGQVSIVARQVTSLLARITEQQAEPSRIFKLTGRSARAIAELPFASPIDEQTFADIVDYLYFLLYEAPGAGSLRYLENYGGPLEKRECEVVFVVKRLRNHFRHDQDHGTPSEVRKKRDALQADLRARSVKNLTEVGELRKLHRILLEEALTFLRTLDHRLQIGT